MKPETCALCPMFKEPGAVFPLPFIGTPRLIIIGEAPGKTELETGLPFVGDSGHWLRRNILRPAGIRDTECFIDNSLRCLIGGKSGNYPTLKQGKAKAEQHCRQYDQFEKWPGVPVMLMGNYAIEKYVGLRNVSRIHGNIVAQGGRLWGMTYHPSAVLRSPNLLRIVAQEVYNLMWANSDPSVLQRPLIHHERPPYNFKHPMAFDLEWNPETYEIHTFGAAYSGDEAYSTHDTSYGRDLLLTHLQSGGQIVGHNILMADLPLLGFSGKEMVKWIEKGQIFDTRAMAHLVHAHFASESKTKDDDKTPKGMGLLNLGSLVRYYKPTPNWKQDTADILEYNGRDCAYNMTLFEGLMRDLKGTNQMHLLQEQQELGALAVEMNKRGIRVDSDGVVAYAQQKQEEKGPLEAALPINPRSPKQIKEWAKSFKIQLRNTKYETLLRHRGKNAEFDKLIEFREDAKSLSTWFPLEEDDDGNIIGCADRVYATFNPYGTDVDRFSSAGPNLQNLTNEGDRALAGGHVKRMPAVRRFFLAEDGEDLLSADYSQLEDWTVAIDSGDAALLDALQRGIDNHRLTAIEWVRIAQGRIIAYDEMEKKSPERYKGKQTNHQAKYGITPHFLAKQLRGNQTKEAVREADGLLRAYFRLHPAILKWQNLTMEQVREDPRIVNQFGRMRYIYGTDDHDRMKKACHFKGCSPGARLVNRAALRLWKLYDFVPCMIVHDELVFSRKYEKEFGLLVQTEMMQPVAELGGVQIPVNLTVGKNYKELEEQ